MRSGGRGLWAGGGQRVRGGLLETRIRAGAGSGGTPGLSGHPGPLGLAGAGAGGSAEI